MAWCVHKVWFEDCGCGSHSALKALLEVHYSASVSLLLKEVPICHFLFAPLHLFSKQLSLHFVVVYCDWCSWGHGCLGVRFKAVSLQSFSIKCTCRTELEASRCRPMTLSHI